MIYRSRFQKEQVLVLYNGAIKITVDKKNKTI